VVVVIVVVTHQMSAGQKGADIIAPIRAQPHKSAGHMRATTNASKANEGRQ